MRHDSYTSHPGCPIEVVFDLVGGKWKGVIIYHLIDGIKRYSYLQRNIPKITPRMLTRQLKDLEVNGLVDRKVYPTVPPTVEYSLSEYGREFIPLFEYMHNLGVTFIKSKLHSCEHNIPIVKTT
jgi:DNA-binding HxlR family transcriptional regulator